MPTQSAGLLMCRNGQELEFFLIHPGGPFFVHRNEGVWSIPKGLPEKDETLLETAQREFFEETGIKPSPPFHSLESAKMKSGKILYVWTFEGEWNSADGIKSNLIQIEFAARAHKFITIPEADKAEWMTFDTACVLINPAQIPFLERARIFFQKK